MSERINVWRVRLAYGLGDVGSNCAYATIETFQVLFLMEVFRLGAGALVWVLVAGRVVDVFAGLAFGLAADRTIMASGRYRPYLLFGAVPFAASYVMLFTGPALWPRLLADHPVGVALGTATIFAICYTAVNVPYSAMLAVVANTDEERKTIAAIRFAMAAATIVGVQFCVPFLLRKLSPDNPAKSWSETALLLSAVGLASLLACYKGSRELPTPRTERSSVYRSIGLVIRSKRCALLLGAVLLSLMALSCRTATSPFFLEHGFKKPQSLGLFLAASSGGAMAACCVVPFLPPDVRRRNLAAWSASAASICSLAFFFVRDASLPILGSFQLLYGLSVGALIPALFALAADIPSTEADFAGKQLTGVIAAATLIAVKTGSLLGQSVVAVTVDRFSTRLAMSAEPQSHLALSSLLSIIPAGLLACASLLFKWANVPSPPGLSSPFVAESRQTQGAKERKDRRMLPSCTRSEADLRW